MKNRLWVPVPAKAIPIRVANDARDDLDILERTILRLLRVRPSTASELAAKLGFADPDLTDVLGSDSPRRAGEELVDSALRRLVDRAIAEPHPHAPDRYQTRVDDGEITVDLLPGWAVYVPHSRELLPTIFIGASPPVWTHASDRVERKGAAPEVTLSKSEIPAMLLRLAARDPESWVASGPTVSSDTASDAQFKFEPGPRVQALYLDLRGRWIEPITCWSQVVLIPSRSGPSDIVAFEPVLQPDFSPADGVAVSPRLRLWMSEEDQGIWDQLAHCAREDAEQLSVVLAALRLTPEIIDKDIEDHMNHLRTMVRVIGEFTLRGDPSLGEELRRAHRWLALSKRDSSLHRQVEDSYTRLIEMLCSSLGKIAEKATSEWLTAMQHQSAGRDGLKRLKNELSGRLSHRLAAVGLAAVPLVFRDRIRTEVEKSFAGDGMRGAGRNLGRWLLPIVLAADESSADAYGSPIRTALRVEPSLFRFLDDLLHFRNVTVHMRQEKSRFEGDSAVDLAFVRVLAAVCHAYGAQPGPSALPASSRLQRF